MPAESELTLDGIIGLLVPSHEIDRLIQRLRGESLPTAEDEPYSWTAEVAEAVRLIDDMAKDAVQITSVVDASGQRWSVTFIREARRQRELRGRGFAFEYNHMHAESKSLALAICKAWLRWRLGL